MSQAAAFAQLCRARTAARAFAATKIAPTVLREVLELAQTAPSSFNLQPYRIVVVQSKEQREALAGAMLGPSNARRVREAPVTVVFAADRDPSQLTRRVMKLETEHGADPAYVARLPATVSFLLGKGLLSKAFRAAATHLLSPLSPTPKISHSLDGWACKNTALAAGTFMLAAQAHGLATAPMEGFDERRVGFLLRIPADRFSIPLVVTTGYSAKEADGREGEDKKKPRPRSPLSEVASADYFGAPFPDRDQE